MIIDIRGLLKKVMEARKAKEEVTFEMRFENGYFVPKMSKDSNRIHIEAEHHGGELVGLAIVEIPFIPNKIPAILSSNGLFIRRDQIKATDIMLFSSYEDAVNTVKSLSKHTVTNKLIGALSIYACYQKDRELGLMFMELH